MAEKYVSAGAALSACKLYRYVLWREWRGTHDPKNWKWYGTRDGAGNEIGEPKACVFVMLTPSTADGARDDATVRKCVAYAKAWSFERLEIVNIFAYRTRHPRELFAMAAKGDPYGPENQRYVRDATSRAGRIVCAWGAHGTFADMHDIVRGWMDDRDDLLALGFTQSGQPKHPLYVPLNVNLVRMPD
jgi:hypothetical protein